MVPQLTIFIIAIIGAFVHGVVGFFVWGVIAYIAVLLLGWVLRLSSGGRLPRQLRGETATDFVAQYPDLVKQAFNGASTYESAQKVGHILEEIAKEAIRNNPSNRVETALRSEVFLQSGGRIAQEQDSEASKNLVEELVSFLRRHPLWYGGL